jgi:PAS domain S-box-containing protein
MIAPLPANETLRLRELRRYAVLDTPFEAAFDRITRMAARLLNVPIATVTLIDETRQWFKSAYGLKNRETSRDVSFCAHAILDDRLMLVADAALDPRFQRNPLVLGEPHIRFYAGVPLTTAAGYNLGTLCAIDTVPRDFSVEEREILTDLAALVRDELELRLALRDRALQATAIHHLRAGVLATDPTQPDNPIIFSNPGFFRITGYDREEIVGQNCRFLQGPETDHGTVAIIREGIANRQTTETVILNYRKDGTPFWNELTISPVHDESCELINFVGLQRDITERRKLENLRDDLTHMIIHDLRSPLSAVIGFLDLLERGITKAGDAKQAGYVTHARNGAQKLADMIASLLDINRLESGEMPIDLQAHDLTHIVRMAVESGIPAAGSGKSLICDLPDEPIIAICDAELVGRVLLNLISNALKYTRPGDSVRVGVTQDEAIARVSVSDNGPGIPPEFHKRIFEKFGQVEARKASHSTGLGLAFCKLALEAQGGTIDLASEVGRGSTFSFRLPARSDR